MKRLDYIALPVIFILALGLGWHLFDSLGKKAISVDQFDLSDISTFEEKTELNQPTNKDQYILARQWSWGEEITLRSGQDYILHLATGDIAHSFHLPAKVMGQKIDILLLPGTEYLIKLENLRPGVYPIGCTEYCGIEHNKMRSKMIILE